MILRRAIPSIAAALAATSAMAQTPERPRAVVELFTSQGCSSCPPADRLMTELAKDPTLIVLTLPVDYWDYLGWKDTLAHGAFSYRQKAYSAMRGDRKVYTPQAVVNGAAHAVGSDRAQIERAATTTRSLPGVLSAGLALVRTPGGFAVDCPELSLEAGAGHLWALAYVREREVQIGRGENSGRSVTYANVVRQLLRVGECRGPAARVEIPQASLTEEADGLVVLLQGGSERKPAQIIAASRISRR
jgi:hypothetical protein